MELPRIYVPLLVRRYIEMPKSIDEWSKGLFDKCVDANF